MTPHHKPKNVKLSNNLRRKQNVSCSAVRDIAAEQGRMHRETALQASTRALARMLAADQALAA
jgi:hypothetical protein